MPRPKKDGRFINYFLDRSIYDRLKAYAEDKGQSMTTAIERILSAHLDQYEQEHPASASEPRYCESCGILTGTGRCPSCGSRELRVPLPGDYCFLTEKELLWSNAMEELLTDNGIPTVTKNTLGAGLTSKIGAMQERVRFYVPYLKLKPAKALEEEFFSAKFDGELE